MLSWRRLETAAAACSRDSAERVDATLDGAVRLHRQEIPEKLLPRLGEDRFWMELHALDRMLTMAQAHDQTVIGLRGDLELFGQRIALDDKRVIACSDQAGRKIVKDCLAVMADFARLRDPIIEKVDLGQILRKLLDKQHALVLKPAIQVVTRVPDQPTWLETDAELLSYALDSSLQDALNALPDGGKLEAMTGIRDVINTDDFIEMPRRRRTRREIR